MGMERTSNEQTQLEAVRRRLQRLRDFLNASPEPGVGSSAEEWFVYLTDMKAIVGNASNGLSFVATLMAKAHIERVLPMRPFDAALKPMGAPGLDIDERTVDGRRVIAEIKTTTPYLGDKLGASQKSSFVKDFVKLQRDEADHKFFFVTDKATFDVVRRRYASALDGVVVVLLPSGDEFSGSPATRIGNR